MRLTEYSHGSGWACKLSQGELAQVLKHITHTNNPNVLVGLETPDDGGVVQLENGLQLIQTVDYFTPIVDSPFDWGRIAAANALSDIYAMGGKPLTALQLVSWPRDDLSFQILSEVIKGGSEIMQEAGCTIIGGHSIDDREPKYGFAVTGLVDKKIYKKTDVQFNDKLYLTKPLGSGIVATAIKKGIATKSQVETITKVMTTLNFGGLKVADFYNANAITDITGFGLLGHLSEMLIDKNLAAEIYANKVPVVRDAEEFLNEGIFSSGSKRNLDAIKDELDFEEGTEEKVKLFTDAQTSGGLLLSIADENKVDSKYVSENFGIEIWEIGKITKRYNHKINIINI